MRGFNSYFRLWRKLRLGSTFSFLAVVFILCGIIIPIIPEKDDAEAATVNPHVASTISFTSDNDTASLTVNPTSTGTFATTSGTADIRFSIATNNYSGHTLSVRSSKTTLDKGTDQILSLASSVTQEQFSNAGNTTLNNRWGYKPNYYNSEGNTRYLASPTATNATLDHTMVANTDGKDYTISLGVRVDTNLASGTYVNDTLVLEYVANPIVYTITFSGADDDIVSNVPTNISGESSSTTEITIPSNVPTRRDYTFVKWCNVRPTEVAGGQTCSGISVNPGDKYGLNYTQSNLVTLYAVWTSNKGCNRGATTIGTGVTATDAVCMQDINDTVIASMTEDAQYTLIDERDSNPYFISKLADGKVWMTQNLGYSLDDTVTLTHHNTDLGYTVQNLNQTWLPSHSTTQSASDTYDYGADEASSYTFLRYYTSSGSTSTDTYGTTCNDASTCNHGLMGTMYNFSATFAENTDSASQYESRPDSVCPAGWRLPNGYTYDAYAEYNTVGRLYGYLARYVASGNSTYQTGGFNAIREAPMYLVRTGYRASGTYYNSGSTGYYWVRTVAANDANYGMAFNSSNFYALQTLTKVNTYPIRCIARMANPGTTTVIFQGNGAHSGNKANIIVDSGNAVDLSDTVYYRANYYLSGWNTKADGTGTAYSTSDTVFTKAGTSTTVTLYAQWEAAYEIVYNGNNPTGNSTMPVSHAAVDGTTINLYAPNYIRTGYGFVGWSLTQIDPDAANAAALMSNAKIWGPNETITANYETFGSNVPTAITLYAVWVKSSGNLQNWHGCSSLTAAQYSDGTITPGSVIGLTDTRDNNTYAVAKLADGNCWMIENLRLSDNGFSDPSKSESFGGVFDGLASSEDSNFSQSTVANSKYGPDNITGSNIYYRIPRYNNNNTNFGGTNSQGTTLETNATANNNHSQWYGYGNYYSFAAAIANTEQMTNRANISTSICPAGWFLPYSANINSNYTNNYMLLILAQGGSNSYTSYTASSTPTGAVMSNRLRTYPNNFVYGGSYSGSSASGRSTVGNYWAGTVSSSYYGNDLKIQTSSVAFTNDYFYMGYSVRCLVYDNYRLRYDGNNADAGQTMSVNHHATPGASVDLYASNFKRAGYGFLGWSFTQIDPDAANFSTQLSNATVYGPNETITLPGTITGDLTLYAVWIKSAGNLQGWTGCSSMSTNAVTALKDTRDNQVYAVAKLADGNCWMIENLRLDAANSTDSTKAQGFGGVFIGLANSETNITTLSTDNSLYSVNPSNSELQTVVGDYANFRIPRYNNTNTNYATSAMSYFDSNVYSYGHYYNTAAAMATTAHYTTAATSEAAGSSICPTGWVLPNSDAQSSSSSQKAFNRILADVNGGSTSSNAALRSYPNNFIYSGYYSAAAPVSRGTYGYYLSRSVYSAANVYYLNIRKSGTSQYTSIANITNSNGFSVRCVAASGVQVTLDSNNGSGIVQRAYVASGSSLSLSTSTFEMRNKKISSWNTAANGSGTSYSTSITPSSNITLYAQWTNAYTITYDGNNNTNSANMNAYFHSNISTGTSIMLYSPNYTRDGYGFLGWSTTQIDPDAANFSTQLANAKVFGPNEDVVANATNFGVSAPSDVTLYAVWISSAGNLQGWDGCKNMTAATYSNGTITVGSVTALTDTRDNQTYAVAKLPDGSCWITEPMRLDPSNANISALNTNAPTESYLSKRGTAYTSCTSNNSSCIDRLLGKPPISNTGYYYNFYTATVGNATYTDPAPEAGDICPTGWTLPTYGTASQFASLTAALGGSTSNLSTSTTPTAAVMSTRLRTYPVNLRYNGYASTMSTTTSTLASVRVYGYYSLAGIWSSNTANAYAFVFNSSVLYNNSSNYRYYGTQVACVKRPNTVYYNGNGADAGSSMVVHHTATPNSQVTLYASNFKRAGYGFLGWSFTQIDPDAANFSTQLSNATVYGPNETITLPGTITGDLTLYAVWIKSAGNLQGWTGCSSLSINGVTALKDTRDNQVYAVAKLADGNCWMIENLRLEATDSIDPAKSQGFGGLFTGLASSETSNFLDSITANSLYSATYDRTSGTSITGSMLSSRIPRYNHTNTANTVSTMTSGSQNVYSYGNYYNFPAANANTSELTSYVYSENSGTSICPLGWKLPTTNNSTTKNYGALNLSVNSGSTSSSAGLRAYPNNFVFSGYIYSSSFYDRGTRGNYISTTAYGTNSFYEFNYTATTTTNGNPVYRYVGNTVRCIVASGLTLTIDANDGSGRLKHIYTTSGSTVNLSSLDFITDGYAIDTWNTNAAGTGTSYPATTTYTVSSSTTLYAQWGETYTIEFNGNGADSGSTTSIVQLTASSSTYLTTSGFVKSGYGFLGWALNSGGTGTVYGPNETVEMSTIVSYANSSNVITMYAVWLQSTGVLQNWTGCSSLATPSVGTATPDRSNVVALTDNRDGTVYVVARLADGDCWMSNDLTLGDSELTTDLTSLNTNLDTTVSASTFNGWRITAVPSSPSATVGYVLPISGLYGKPGVLYNFCASSAGTACVTSGTDSPVYDICPAGWMISNGNSSFGYRRLVSVGYDTPIKITKGVINGGAGIVMSTNSSSSTSNASYREMKFANGGSSMDPFVFSYESPTLNSHSYSGMAYSLTNGGAIRCINKANKTRIRIHYDDYDSTTTYSVSVTPYYGSDGDTLTVDKNTTYSLSVAVKNGFHFVNYVASAGTITSPNYQSTTINTGNNDIIDLTVNVAFSGDYIQDVTESDCTTTETTVYDKRDFQPYKIKRMSDGVCWMTTNLNLGDSSYPLREDLTSENSNLTNTVTASTFTSWRKTSPTFTSTSGVYIKVSGTDSTSNTAYGTLYNYYAATGGTVSGTGLLTDADDDICPAGWRLPTSGLTNSEYGDIYSNYNSYNLMHASTSNSGAAFALAGYFTSSLVSPGSYGSYWSGTADNYNGYANIMSLQASNSSVSVLSSTSTSRGHSVRCILGKKISSITYLQDFNTLSNSNYISVLKSMDENTTYSLRDNRDNQYYNVAKLKDNRIWMVDNLNLGATTLSTNLTSTNSNVINTVSYSTFNGYKKTTPESNYGYVAQYVPVSGTDTNSGTKYGTLYSYWAAIAGQPFAGSINRDSAYDICPAGWRLPTNYSNTNSYNEAYGIFSNYSGKYNNTIASGGAGLAPAGYFSGTSIYNTGTASAYWNSTAKDNLNVAALAISSINGTLNYSGSFGGYGGRSVRCIAKNKAARIIVRFDTGISKIVVNGVEYSDQYRVNVEMNSRTKIEVIVDDGYTFSGWTYTGGTVNDSTNPSTYMITTKTVGTLTATVTSTSSYTSMQNLSASQCTTTATTVKDSRDGQAYRIQRLADGKCWMLDNLNLGVNSLTTDLTSSNSNLSTTVTASTFNGWRKTNSTFSYNTNVNTAGQFIPQRGKDPQSGTGYGALYNYYAATGGSISGTSFAVAEYDICPAGWRMPTGGASGDFAKLYQNSSYNTYSKMVSSTGARFALTGVYDSSIQKIARIDSMADYWTSAPYSNNSRLNLSLWNNTVYATQYENTYIYNGNIAAIRCVLKDVLPTINDIDTFQDFNVMPSYMKTSVISSMSYNTLYSLTDYRDAQPYNVAKLADGAVYMVDNLNLGDPTYAAQSNNLSLSFHNTNIASTYSYGFSNFYNARKTANFSSLTEMGYINVSGTDSTSGTKFGTIYNYCAASVNEICTSNNSANATRDLCPAGWSLPTGGASSQFVSLYNAYGSYANMRKTVASGGAGLSYSGATTPYLGTNMLQSTIAYWSKTRYDGVAMNALDVYSGGSIGSNDFKDRNFGGYLRCRLK